MIGSAETGGRRTLAQLHRHDAGLETPALESVLLGHQPLHDVHELLVKGNMGIPESLAQDAGPDPNLLVLGVVVVEFTPHTSLAADHVHSLYVRVERVYLPPGDVGAIGEELSVANSNIQIKQVVHRQNHLVLPPFQGIHVLASSPPLDHIVALHWQIDMFVRPVYGFLLGSYFPPNFLLSLPVVGF